MRLTVQTDYALRVLIYLAIHKEELATIAAISERYEISKNHLMKVVQLLGHEGFVETVRGRAGGLRLARPAEEINVGQVVRVLERDAVLVECFSPCRNECLITPACRLKGALREALEAFFAALDRFSLARLTDDNRLLQQLLKGEAT